jgi:hypothetical protein
MARLIVEAEGTGGEGESFGVARPNTRDKLYLVVSVSNNNGGTPRTGLTAGNFQVDPIIVAPGGGAVTIANVGEAHPGAYLLEVVPIPAATWQLGRYIFWIAVVAGSSKGQTVCSVFVH